MLILQAEAKLEKLSAKTKQLPHVNEAVCAFVVFNHEESVRRCLNDYSRTLFMPEELQFKISKQRLEVTVLRDLYHNAPDAHAI